MTGEFAIAVHALVYLSRRGGSASSEVLAQSICTNPARVRKVMALLKRAGLLVTREGADGGYSFRLDPGQVTLSQVARAVGAVFVSASWKPGRDNMECLIASGMAGVLEDIYKQLDALCLERLEHTTLAQVSEAIFQNVPPGTPLPCFGNGGHGEEQGEGAK